MAKRETRRHPRNGADARTRKALRPTAVEAANRESEEKYRAIFENANDLIVYTGVDGRFVETNGKLEEIFGYRRKDFLGRHFSEVGVLDEHDLRRAARALRATLAGNPPGILEFQVKRRDGTTASVEVNPRIIHQDGEVLGSILIIRDITERKKAEEALRQAHAELERKVNERTASLEEANAALRFLLKQRDEDRSELEERMLFNVRELVFPYLEKMAASRLDEQQRGYLQIIEANLKDILSPLVRGMSMKYLHLTPAEIQVANLVKHGESTKSIARRLHLSPKTVEFHRDNIRKKIGIKNKRVNLRTYLLSIQ